MSDVLKEKQSAKKRNSKYLKIITTIIIFYAHLSYGFLSFIVGPSINDIQKLLNTESVFLYFTIFPVGYTLGAFCGFIYNYVNRKLMVVFLFTIMGISLMSIPHVSTLVVLLICGGLIGIGMGGWDCAMNVWLVEMWKENSGPILQAASMFYSIGSILGPHTVKPFLSNHEKNQNTTDHNSTISSNKTQVNGTSLLTTVNPLLTSSDQISEIRSKLTIPYSIAGSIVIIAALLIFFLFFYRKTKTLSPKPTKRVSVGSFLIEKNQTLPIIVGWHVKLITLLSAVLVGSYFSIEVTYLQLFPTYALNSDLKLPPADAASVLSAITAAEALGRFISIFISMKLNPNYLLTINFIILLIGFLIITIGKSVLLAMWIGNIIIGLGMASTSPGIYSFIKQFLAITNTRGTILVSSAGLAEAILPVIVNIFIKTNPLCLIYAIFILLAIAISSFISIIMIGKFCSQVQPPPKSRNQKKSIQEINTVYSM